MEDIRELGIEAFCPMEIRAKRERGRRIEKQSPLIPGYLFVHFDRERDGWEAIYDIDGVMDILSNADMPLRVPDADMERLKRAYEAGVFDYTRPAALGEGQPVEIMEGPFAGLIARVRCASPNKRVKVLLEALGTIEIDLCALRATK